MTPTRYHNHAARTRPVQHPREAMIMATFGIGGEGGEVLATIRSNPAHNREKRIKELGDLCWYVALLADVLGMDTDLLWFPTFDGNVTTWYGGGISTAIAACAVVEATKKHLYHSKPPGIIRDALPVLTSAIYHAAQTIDSSLPEVWAANVAKLKARHPGEWTPDYPGDSEV